MLLYKDKIIELLVRATGIDTALLENLKDDENFRSYGFNSISGVDFVILLETEFNIEIAAEDYLIENLDTLEKINGLVMRYLSTDAGVREELA